MKSRISIVIIVTFFAFLLRLPLLNGSFWMDEAAQAIESMRPFSEQHLISGDFQPPLYHYWVHFFTNVNLSEAWLRLASLIPGVGVIALIFMLPSSSKQERAALTVGAVLTSLSAFHVFYSQELRQYMLAAFWAILSWVLLFRWIQEKSRKTGFALALVHAAGLYSMYVYPFSFLAQGLYVLFHERKHLRGFIGISIIASALFAPWIPSFKEQLRVGTTLQRSLPGWSEVVSTPQIKALPMVLLKFSGGGKSIDLTVFNVLYYGIPLILFAVMVWNARKRVPTYLWYWGGVSVFLSWFVSFIVPVISPKRVLFALPAFFLLMGYGIQFVRAKQVRKALLIMFIAYQTMGLVLYWTTPAMQREDWRTAITTIHRRFSENNTIAVFGFPEPFAPWRFYELRYEQQYPTVSFPTVPVSKKIADIQMKPSLQYARVVVFDYLLDLTDPNRYIEAQLRENGYRQVGLLDTKNIGFIRVFEREAVQQIAHTESEINKE